MKNEKVHYDFNLSIFKKEPFYIRLAKEHIFLSELNSDVIDWEVSETRSKLKIPCEYLIHYNIRSVIGINDDQSPIFGNRHTAKITLPPLYPQAVPILKMVTPVWHPNIKWSGNFKGRICGNAKAFGTSYELYMLVIRIGEILQYKNYHAEHTPPFPEDSDVAKWVKEYAEPKSIIDKDKDIYIDETPLVQTLEMKNQEVELKAEELDSPPSVNDSNMVPKISGSLLPNSIKIKGIRKPPPKPRPRISIKKK